MIRRKSFILPESESVFVFDESAPSTVALEESEPLTGVYGTRDEARDILGCLLEALSEMLNNDEASATQLADCAEEIGRLSDYII